MTNRHVAEVFTQGLGTKNLSFSPSWSASVNFRKEVVATPEVIDLTVTDVIMVLPFWDMALLRVSGLPAGDPLALSVQHPDDLSGREVIVVGYPAFDPRNDTDLQNRIFGGVYGVKRLQPGKEDPRRVVESFGNEVNALSHDASMLGGNSGSLVMDVISGEVIGLQFGGLYLDANFAVPTFELARDSRVVDTGINFSGTVESTTDWTNRWNAADSAGSVKESGLLLSAGDGNEGVGVKKVDTPVRPGAPGSITVTIPLNITVSLGNSSLQTVSIGEAPAVTRGILGGSRNEKQILANAMALSSEARIGSGALSHAGGLTCASLSELAYADQNSKTRSRVRSLGFDTC